MMAPPHYPPKKSSMAIVVSFRILLPLLFVVLVLPHIIIIVTATATTAMAMTNSPGYYSGNHQHQFQTAMSTASIERLLFARSASASSATMNMNNRMSSTAAERAAAAAAAMMMMGRRYRVGSLPFRSLSCDRYSTKNKNAMALFACVGNTRTRPLSLSTSSTTLIEKKKWSMSALSPSSSPLLRHDRHHLLSRGPHHTHRSCGSRAASAFFFPSYYRPTTTTRHCCSHTTTNTRTTAFGKPRSPSLSPPSSSSSLWAAGNGNYYAAATLMSSPFSTTKTTSSSSVPPNPDDDDMSSFPKWWPISESSLSSREYITIEDHIAHVIVPNITNNEIMGGDGGEESDESGEMAADKTLTCEGLVQWVIRAAKASKQGGDRAINESINPPGETADETDPESGCYNRRRSRIESEWLEGESVSSDPTRVLDPAHRHDPSLYPLDVVGDDDAPQQPNLIAAELLALGSVWHLPYSSSKSVIDRFDPSCGVKPTRLNAGDMSKPVRAGDYFRVHFDPRRFADANLYDWGKKAAAVASDGIVDNSGGVDDKEDDGNDGKLPGVVVARDDDAGYVVIDKPPNVPVHARVDNLLENVASSVGRALWLERRETILLSSDMELDPSRVDVDDVESMDANTTMMSNDDADVAGGERRAGKIIRKKKKNRKQKVEQLVYVATPQRLDQNTSGLIVVATKKSFAAYFAKLLRVKTSGQLSSQQSSSPPVSSSSSCGVHKTYRCLACIAPRRNAPPSAGEGPATASMASEIDRLKHYTVMRHFLEPSIRSPKLFVPTVPEDVDNAESWAECLLRITNISEVCTVIGNTPSDVLAQSLWGEHGKPDGCIAVAELEIELLTGRTHQIRGQLAAEGFPLVGDVQYGGAVPNTSSLWKERCKGRAESFLDSERLALQCCSLEFLDPHHYAKPDGSDAVKRSEKWNTFRLDSAFWTPFLAQYHMENAEITSSEATSSLDVETPLLRQTGEVFGTENVENEPAAQELPPRVLLSPGSHKYIVVRATLPTEKNKNELWFVRSASPEECGGPYHANVAEELLLQLKSSGCFSKIEVMGGGRIDYMEDEEISHARVFGFSYGFGKGDHERVASIIEVNTSTVATFDNSDNLY